MLEYINIAWNSHDNSRHTKMLNVRGAKDMRSVGDFWTMPTFHSNHAHSRMIETCRQEFLGPVVVAIKEQTVS